MTPVARRTRNRISHPPGTGIAQKPDVIEMLTGWTRGNQDRRYHPTDRQEHMLQPWDARSQKTVGPTQTQRRKISSQSSFCQLPAAKTPTVRSSLPLLLAVSLYCCSTADYREDADRQVYDILGTAAEHVTGPAKVVYIERPESTLRARMEADSELAIELELPASRDVAAANSRSRPAFPGTTKTTSRLPSCPAGWSTRRPWVPRTR